MNSEELFSLTCFVGFWSKWFFFRETLKRTRTLFTTISKLCNFREKKGKTFLGYTTQPKLGQTYVIVYACSYSVRIYTFQRSDKVAMESGSMFSCYYTDTHTHTHVYYTHTYIPTHAQCLMRGTISQTLKWIISHWSLKLLKTDWNFCGWAWWNLFMHVESCMGSLFANGNFFSCKMKYRIFLTKISCAF